ncbi:MAG: hypothetical protein FWD86_03730, partial [Firmicutes bacterium]|nr:hypothetical protein [Bacillota bacterium]
VDGGFKGGKTNPKGFTPLWFFCALFLHKKRTDKNEKRLSVEVGFDRKKENQLKTNTDIVPIK